MVPIHITFVLYGLYLKAVKVTTFAYLDVVPLTQVRGAGQLFSTVCLVTMEVNVNFGFDTCQQIGRV